MPSRIAARSTTQGTPVKSCSSTRAGANEISFCSCAPGFQPASASMSFGMHEARVLVAQQIFEKNFQRVRKPSRRPERRCSSLFRLKISTDSPASVHCVLVPKEFVLLIPLILSNHAYRGL